MPYSKLVGARLPQVRICEVVDGQQRVLRASDLLARGRAMIVGMPGAFTPLCSERHLPSLIRNADRLRAAGFTEVACVVTSNPFAVDAWAKAADPLKKVRFLSDGNLAFTRALGLTTHEPRIFLGECSQRYLLTARDGAIDSVRVEDSIINLSCADPDEFVLEIG
jgi:2-Cys peroxiredoxin 5